jgi:Leucine-rich repeat (LRR) protein
LPFSKSRIMDANKNKPTNRKELKNCPKIDLRYWKEHKRNSEKIYRLEISDKLPSAEVLAYFPNVMEIEAKYLKFVPKDLFKFSQLKILTFYDCKIGEIPPEIGFLQDLEVLKFDVCEIFLEKKPRTRTFWEQLSGKNKYPIYEPEPALLQLCNLLNINELCFRLRPLYEFPEEINRLENLESLSFLQTDLMTLPQNLQVLTNLKKIEINANYQAHYKQIMEVLSKCRFLEEISLAEIRREDADIDIAFLQNHERLRAFSARNTFVKNFELLATFSQIEKIDLSRPETHYHRKGITLTSEFGNLQNLKELNLFGNKNPQLLAKISPKIPNWQQLERLDLGNCELKQIPEEIGELAKLSHLNLSENELTELPHTFDYLTNLKTLNLKACKIHPKHINRLRERMPKLNILID